MTNVEYLTKKNIITRKHLGITLVPSEQIVFMHITAKMVRDMQEYIETGWSHFPLSAKNCTYCARYNTDAIDCEKCPMHLADNDCNRKEDSTYNLCYKALKQPDIASAFFEELRGLAKAFVDGNKHLLGGEKQ